MLAAKVAFVLCLGFAISACTKTGPAVSQRLEPASSPSRPIEKQKKPFTEIDLSRIGHIAAKGRVQDRDYNELVVVNDLVANGKESIPFLISKLDDTTVIHEHVMDFWPEVTVGDVALFILSDFSTDSTWTKQMVPGTSWEELFETKKNPDTPAWEYLDAQLARHGRRWLKAKWQKIWTSYKDRIVWDEQERCFRVA